MFQRNYKVKGEDVNDFMLMQNAAYLKYSSKLLDTFLYYNGYTTVKLNKLKVGLEKKNDVIKQYKPLFFTQHFTIILECKKSFRKDDEMIVGINFYNNQKELCASITRELFWFDYLNLQTISPPKGLVKFFTANSSYLKVG